MNLSRKLKTLTFSPGNDTGADLSLATLPDDIGGAAAYVRALEFRVFGTVTTDSPNQAAYLSRLLDQISLTIPDVAQLVNLKGNRTVRMYRIRNGGEAPPAASGGFTTQTAYASPGAQNVDVTFVVEFSSQDGRKLDDHALPVKLLKNAILKVTYGTLAQIDVAGTALHFTAQSLQLETYVQLCRKRELRMPPLPILDSIDIASGNVQPTIPPCEGRITHLLVQPTSDKVFPAASDYTLLGLGFGDVKFTEDTYPTSGFYDEFNRIATTDIDKHTVAQTDQSAFIPLVFAPGGKNGQHITNEVVPANTTPRLLTDAAANGYAWVRRYVLPRSHPAWKKACAICGISPTKPMPASHKPNPSPDVTDFVPAKVA